MKTEWFTSEELAQAKLPDMPHTRQGIENFITQSGARSTALARPRDGRGGGYEYHYRLLPPAARHKLVFLQTELPAERTDASRLLWRKYDALTGEQKAVCRKRLDVIVDVEDMKASGIGAMDAVRHVCRKAGVAIASYYEWRKMTQGCARQDWQAALAPSFSPAADGLVSETAPCHPDAWDVLTSDYLRSEEPAFSACYRRMTKTAKRMGWAPIPSERTLRRHLDIKVPKAVQILARKGKDEAKKLFPAQRRSVAHLQAMQITNTDGHKLDLNVSFPGRAEWTRVILMAIQDVYSRKILSWTLCEAETWEAVRTIIGNMVETHGIPGHLYMDNGRAFASKKISGQVKHRHRFKITPDEVSGLLRTLGIEGHFVTVRSGQSKPIERGWKDLAEEICKHPKMSGCYTGNNPMNKPENYGKRAVAIDELEAHVAMCVDEYNARTGRETETAKGRSFDETFAESMADPANIVRFASPSQRSLWMLAAESVTARKPDGAIHLFGNRYFHRDLNQVIGKKVTVRFDPSDLHKPAKIYDLQDRFLCEAACVDTSGFDCQDAARQFKRAAAAHKKSIAAELQDKRRLNDLQLAEIMKRGAAAAPTDAKPTTPKVTRLITRNPLAPAPAAFADDMSDDEFESKFSRAMAKISRGDDAIIPFRRPEGASRKTRAAK